MYDLCLFSYSFIYDLYCRWWIQRLLGDIPWPSQSSQPQEANIWVSKWLKQGDCCHWTRFWEHRGEEETFWEDWCRLQRRQTVKGGKNVIKWTVAKEWERVKQVQRFPGERAHVVLGEISAGSSGLGWSVGSRSGGGGLWKQTGLNHKLLTHFVKVSDLRQTLEDDPARFQGRDDEGRQGKWLQWGRGGVHLRGVEFQGLDTPGLVEGLSQGSVNLRAGLSLAGFSVPSALLCLEGSCHEVHTYPENEWTATHDLMGKSLSTRFYMGFDRKERKRKRVWLIKYIDLWPQSEG